MLTVLILLKRDKEIKLLSRNYLNIFNYCTLQSLILSSISILLSPCKITAVQFVHVWQILRVSLIFYKRGRWSDFTPAVQLSLSCKTTAVQFVHAWQILIFHHLVLIWNVVVQDLSFIFYSMWIKTWKYAIFFTFYFLLFGIFS